jgi:DNA-binding IclR family transcriptional regulator
MRLVKGLLERCVEATEHMATAGGPMRLSDLAQALDMPKAAAHRLLRELCTLGWVEQDGAEGPYRLTLRFGLLGHRVLQTSGLPELIQPLLQRLADRTQELVRLTIATGDGLAWLASAQGAPPGLVYQPAMDGPLVLHATANGKAYLASFDDKAALALARANGFGRSQPTARTLRDEAALRADLARVRKRGYGLAEQEAELGVTALAMAVRGVDGTVRGTVSVAGPTLRLPATRYPALAALVAETAAELASVWPTTPIQRKVQRA